MVWLTAGQYLMGKYIITVNTVAEQTNTTRIVLGGLDNIMASSLRIKVTHIGEFILRFLPEDLLL